MPSQWYFAVRGILNTVPLILDDFRVSSQPALGGSAMYAAPPVEPEVPKEISLYQNYPNPFNPTTNIRFGVPSDAHVVLQVYNVLGQRVATLLDEVRNAGFHTVQFDASGMANGVYFYRLSVVPLTSQDPGAANGGDNSPQSYVLTRKLLLMK
jgi:hypothetical protein